MGSNWPNHRNIYQIKQLLSIFIENSAFFVQKSELLAVEQYLHALK